MTKHSIYNLLVLRAEFDQALHEAVMKRDTGYIGTYVQMYCGDDRKHYNFDEPVDIDSLYQLVLKADKEYSMAIKTGNLIMGM